ncbi:MAG: type II toxin-antitoxin system VapC family toxin [Terriglobia bacterium]
MSAYADTSFLVSLYVMDGNSARAAGRIKSAPLPLSLTLFNEVEIINAFYLRLYRKEIDPSQIRAAQGLFQEDIENGIFEVMPLSSAVFDRAKRLAEKHTVRLGTRTLDVLHVASALVLKADTFYTFDVNQGKLAKAEGLAVP